jgi:hypothetical protein
MTMVYSRTRILQETTLCGLVRISSDTEDRQEATRVLTLSTSDIWSWVFPCCGDVLCTAWCLAVPLASTHWMPLILAPESYHDNRKCLHTNQHDPSRPESALRENPWRNVAMRHRQNKLEGTVNGQKAHGDFQAGGLSYQCSTKTPGWVTLHKLFPFLFLMTAPHFGCFPGKGQRRHNVC